MSKENENATQPTQEVLSAAMQYLSDAVQLSNFRTLDQDVHELISVLLETHFLEEQDLRNKLSLLLQQAKLLTSAFAHLSDEEIIVSLKAYRDDSRS